MGSPCWGAPQQGLMAPNSSEFPDLRVQYLAPRVALPKRTARRVASVFVMACFLVSGTSGPTARLLNDLS